LELPLPRKKKSPEEWTTEEAMRKLFHPKVVKHLKITAAESAKRVTKK